MRKRNEFEYLTIEQIDDEVKERREMLKQLVGTLYPSILCGEIDTLLERKDYLKNHVNAAMFDKVKKDHFPK